MLNKILLIYIQKHTHRRSLGLTQ